MNGLLLVDLSKALIATIVIEEIAALFWKERSLRLAAVVFVANLATNPLLNVTILFFEPELYDFARRLGAAASEERFVSTAIFLGEAAVWLVETTIFWRWGNFSLKRAAFFSLSLNAASYFSGYPLEKLGFWNW